ncbi:MAG: RNA methyltransferase [Candidatus Marinimicrobia bacterium]|nr:RNA methyltransferase [Candidatus Neomarinimicrobiota bacterium]
MGKPHREYIHGLNPAFEVLRAGRRQVTQAYLNAATAESARLRALRTQLERRAVPIELVDKGRLTQLAESHEHQGAVLRCSTYPYVAFEDLLGAPKLLLLDNVEDPHNVGAILRSAEIFGFEAVALAMKGVPDVYPSVVKVSAGATEFLRLCKDRAANYYARAALAAGYDVVALDGGGAVPLAAVAERLQGPLMLVIGGENQAVGQWILNNAQHVVHIAQQGRINSLNASVAAGIAMYALAGYQPH